jgi:hypothetical protein
MRCDGSPDPFFENELNTFMHLWKDGFDDSNPRPVNHILEECESTLQVGLQ